MTTSKKPAAKRAAKKAAPKTPPVTIAVTDLVILKGTQSPVMTVTMLTSEFDGPTEIPVAECSWNDPVAHTAGSQRFKLDELTRLCSAAEANAQDATIAAAERENQQRDHDAKLAALATESARVAEENRKAFAAQAAAQEPKGAV